MIRRTQIPVAAGTRPAFRSDFFFFIFFLQIPSPKIGKRPLRSFRRWIRKTGRTFCASAAFSAVLIFCVPVWASVAGSISGTVKDPAGHVVPGAKVTVREVDTGLLYRARTDGKGDYTFPVLPVGHYEMDVEAQGFRGYQRKGIVLDTNASLAFDVTLAVGDVSQTVQVTDNTVHVETSSTQMGELIGGR